VAEVVESARLLSFFVLAAIAATAACQSGDGDDAHGTSEGAVRDGDLKVQERASLPVDEVSGLGRRLVGGAPQYLAVSDVKPRLLTFDLTAGGKVKRVESHDLAEVVGSRDAPQWEAVAGDARGAVFLLAEASDEILVLAPDLESVETRIRLVIPDGHPLRRDWRADANSRGEGMPLLSNGHILVVKEKGPVAVVEFAPEGAAAEGYRADLALGDREFPGLQAGSTKMVATKHWDLKSSDVDRVSDVSELAVEADGRLLLLTDQGTAIARVERGLRPDEQKVDIKSLHPLPPAVEKPEGLLIANGLPIVASDLQQRGDSLFTLTALPPPAERR